MSRKNKWGWQGKVSQTDSSGIRKSTTKQFRTKREADAWEAKTKTALQDGTISSSNLKVGEFLEKWYEEESPIWKSGGTRRTTRSTLDARILPHWADVPMKKVTVQSIESWYAELRRSAKGKSGKKLSDSTIHKYHAIMHQAFNTAVRWELIGSNPFSRARAPRLDTVEVVPPSLPEVILLMDKAMQHDTDIGTALHLSAVTGARRGEIVALQWGCLNWETGILRIRHGVALNEENKPEIKKPKSNFGRNNRLDENTLSILKEHRQRCDERARICHGKISDDSFIFSLEADGSSPMSPDYFSKQFIKIRRQCNLEHVRLHDLRHYNASSLLSKGVDVVTIANRLGHRDARTTLSIYAHLMEAPDKRASDLIGEEFSN